jgi:uncharacterized protein (DUF952 family)
MLFKDLNVIYHITTRDDWDAAQATDAYIADSLESEGFIHCSTAGQVQATANRFFSGRQDLVLLNIDEKKVPAEIKYENLEGGMDLFPHIYGPLTLGAITRALDLAPNPDGLFRINLTD